MDEAFLAIIAANKAQTGQQTRRSSNAQRSARLVYPSLLLVGIIYSLQPPWTAVLAEGIAIATIDPCLKGTTNFQARSGLK